MSKQAFRLPKDVRQAIDQVNERVIPLPRKTYLDIDHIEPSVLVGDLQQQYKLGTIKVNYPEGVRVEIVYRAFESGTRRLHSVKHRQGKKTRNFHEDMSEIKNSDSWW